MQNKTPLIAIPVVIVILIVGIFLLTRNNPSVNNTTNTVQTETSTTPSTTLPSGLVSAPVPPVTNGETKTIDISNMSFVNGSITISKGTKVIWTNNDEVSHNIVANNGAFRSPILTMGGQYDFIFDTVGTFDYHCEIHPTMTGKIIVE